MDSILTPVQCSIFETSLVTDVRTRQVGLEYTVNDKQSFPTHTFTDTSHTVYDQFIITLQLILGLCTCTWALLINLLVCQI